MKAVEIRSVWYPRAGSEAHPRDVEKVRAQQGSRVWLQPTAALVRVQRPQLRDTEVLIRVRACGLCGSDVAMASQDKDGYARYPFMMRSPIIPGHEFSGEVVLAGSDAKKHKPWLEIGVPVTAECVEFCGKCDFCTNNMPDSCPTAEERGFTVSGAMAEYCVADARHVHSLAELASRYQGQDLFVAGSLLEPLAGVYKALEPAAVGGGTLLIIGAGPIGLAALCAAPALKFAKVLVAEVWRERRVRANRMGADLAFCPVAQKLSQVVLDATRGRGADVVFEASGYAEKNWEELCRLWDRQSVPSHLVFFGQSRATLPLDPQRHIQKFLRISGSHGHSGVWPEVIAHVSTGTIKPFPMVTRTISLNEAPEWFERLQTDKSECKVTITDFS